MVFTPLSTPPWSGPDPRAIGSRAADRPPDEAGSSEWTATSGSLDYPVAQLYFGRAD